VRTIDLVTFGLSALRRQKLRATLTLLGVAIGSATLVISLAVGIGVQRVIDKQFSEETQLRQVTVFPSHDGLDESLVGVPESVRSIEGSMSEAKRERIRKLHVMRWKREQTQPAPKPLTADRVEQLRRLPHVIDAIPELDELGRAYLDANKQSSAAHVYGVAEGHALFTHRLEVGGRFSSSNVRECIVHEYLLYRWGIRDDAAVQAIIGQQVRIELNTAQRSPVWLLTLFEADGSNVSEEEMEVLDKAWKLLPQVMESMPLSPRERETFLRIIRRKSPGAKKQENVRIKETFTVVGVVRAPMKDDPKDEGFLDGPLRDADIIIPRHAAEEFFMKLPRREENGYSRVRLIVDHEDNLEGVVEDVKKMGFHEFSLGAIIQQIKRNVMLVGFAMDFIALVALIVAALGITNTMLTTVLERTREIGIMKAVGAKDRQILTMFLIEGGLIGLIGGVCGVILGWLASFPGNNAAIRILEKQGHKPLPETVFLYPLWLLIMVPVFAMLVTTLAALLPARRAARVEPVIALRHE
jgi:putative ABC transport system permease protein